MSTIILLSWWMYVIKHLSKLIECTTGRMNCNCNWRFINCNKNCNTCTTLMGRCWHGGMLYLFIYLFIILIYLQQIRTIKKKNKTQDVFRKVVNEFQSNDEQKYELDGKGRLMTRKEVWGETIVISIKCSTLWIQHFTIKFASFADLCDRT